jgi:hypothetical protein
MMKELCNRVSRLLMNNNRPILLVESRDNDRNLNAGRNKHSSSGIMSTGRLSTATGHSMA